MKPSTVIHALNAALDASLPTFLWGPPGVGKSDIVRAVAKLRGVNIIDVRALLTDPVDWRGLPVVHNGKADWAQPAFLPTEGSGILFLDELNAAPPSTQAACYQLILDRRVGDYVLPDGWDIVAAGNRETDKAVTHHMPTPLKNRLLHLDVEVDLEDWCGWAFANNIDPKVIAFLRFRPEALHKFDPQSKERSFPTPRSWAMLSRLSSRALPPQLEYDMYSGLVGQGAATEFFAFVKMARSLPSLDAILLSPDKALVPPANEVSACFAVSVGLSAAATEDNFEAVTTYLDRMPEEYNVMSVKYAAERDSTICNSPAFTRWATKHHESYKGA